MTPTLCVEVLLFVGLANYFRWYIKSFSVLAVPLSSLTGPQAMFCWGDSFEALKQALSLVLVLSIWQPERKAQLTTDV